MVVLFCGIMTRNQLLSKVVLNIIYQECHIAYYKISYCTLCELLLQHYVNPNDIKLIFQIVVIKIHIFLRYNYVPKFNHNLYVEELCEEPKTVNLESVIKLANNVMLLMPAARRE